MLDCSERIGGALNRRQRRAEFVKRGDDRLVTLLRQQTGLPLSLERTDRVTMISGQLRTQGRIALPHLVFGARLAQGEEPAHPRLVKAIAG